MDINALVTALRGDARKLAGAALEVDTSWGGSVSMSFLSVPPDAVRAKGAPLVVVFHGFVDQTKRTLPVFDGQHLARSVGGAATILAISDSTLSVSKALNVGWYLGTRQFDLPKALAQVISEVNTVLQPSKLIWVGGSTGAHTVMSLAKPYPQSVCLTANPLAKVTDFHAKHVDAYLDACWEGAAAADVFGKYRVDDASALLSEGDLPRVIVLQNATDHYFLGPILKMLARLAENPQASPSSVMVLSEFFPTHIGHTYPAEPIGRWVSALVREPSNALVDAARVAHPVKPPTPAEAASARQPEAMAERDLFIASLI